MFFASKIGCSGIVFLLMTPWISGPPPTPLTSRPDLSNEVPAVADPDDVNKVQQILQDEGHYRGKVDGVVGLRTRASIRGFQKAENLPITGELDLQTAGKLGVRPEFREAKGFEIPLDKPSAGIKRSNRSRRTGKTQWMPVKKLASTLPPA
ncbi:MAG: peptidoglycan-binding domain-containing protein [Candidatus Sulfotelmatobacter sp.]